MAACLPCLRRPAEPCPARPRFVAGTSSCAVLPGSAAASGLPGWIRNACSLFILAASEIPASLHPLFCLLAVPASSCPIWPTLPDASHPSPASRAYFAQLAGAAPCWADKTYRLSLRPRQAPWNPRLQLRLLARSARRQRVQPAEVQAVCRWYHTIEHGAGGDMEGGQHSDARLAVDRKASAAQGMLVNIC